MFSSEKSHPSWMRNFPQECKEIRDVSALLYAEVGCQYAYHTTCQGVDDGSIVVLISAQ